MPSYAVSDVAKTIATPASARALGMALCAALWLLAGPAQATSTTFFGEDVPLVDGIPASHPQSDAARDAFFALLGDPGTEDFSSFDSGDEAPLNLSFRDPADDSIEIETGTLFDGTGDGFIATQQIAKTGFGISGVEFWKNTTSEDNDDALFEVTFDAAVKAFGFYATAWETLSKPDRTQLVLEVELEDGTLVSYTIPHTTDSTVTGKVLYFGLISDDAFVKATVRNAGSGDGDVIGFDDLSVAHTIIPEPGTGWLLGGGMLALAAARRRALRVHRA